MRRLAALPYMGGKSPTASQRVGKWIADQLPYDTGYCEPFGGMAGVMLHREPVPNEIYNDLDGRLANFWEVIRDDPGGLKARLRDFNLVSYFSVDWAVGHLDDRGVDGAVALAIQCFSMAISGRHRVQYDRGSARRLLEPDIVDRLCERFRRVQIVQRDVCWLLERIQRYKTMVTYLDPPYRSAKGSEVYNVNEVDWDRMTELLKGLEGRAAISGYNDEWDHLGWRCETKGTFVSCSPTVEYRRRQNDRVEKLWLNFRSEGGLVA